MTQEERERAEARIMLWAACCHNPPQEVLDALDILEGCIPIPRTELADLRARAVEAEELSEFAILQLNDWLKWYAPEQFDKDDAARTRSRINNRGGVIAYVTEGLEKHRAFLAKSPQANTVSVDAEELKRLRRALWMILEAHEIGVPKPMSDLLVECGLLEAEQDEDDETGIWFTRYEWTEKARAMADEKEGK